MEQRTFLRISVSATFIFLLSMNAYAQTTCGQAVSQLQQYVASVNQAANYEYYQGIPYKCGGNPMCMQMGLQQLNGWYMQQTNLVNGWYGQIQANCAASSRSSPKKVRGKKGGNESAPELDEEQVASIDVDDEDKTVRIRIPDNPSGYRR